MLKKYLLYVFMLISLSALAQKKKQSGYFSLRGGFSFKDDITKGLAQMSIGLSPDPAIGIGAGIGFINFEKPYLPLTVDVSFFGKPKKISPVVLGSAGYGVYNYSNQYTAVRGGFTGSINLGIALPVKNNNKFILTGGYSIYSFKNGKNTSTTSNYYKNSNIKMVTVTLGAKI